MKVYIVTVHGCADNVAPASSTRGCVQHNLLAIHVWQVPPAGKVRQNNGTIRPIVTRIRIQTQLRPSLKVPNGNIERKVSIPLVPGPAL